MGYFDKKAKEWVVDGKTDGGQSYDCVKGSLFKARSGKYGYSVRLDYSEIWKGVVNGPEREAVLATGEESPYIEANEAARIALATAYRRYKSGDYEHETSEEAAMLDYFPELGTDWILVVQDPPNGWPLMVMTPELWSAIQPVHAQFDDERHR